MQNEQEIKENLDQDPRDQESDINDDRSETTTIAADRDAIDRLQELEEENVELLITKRNLELTVEELRAQLATTQANLANEQTAHGATEGQLTSAQAALAAALPQAAQVPILRDELRVLREQLATTTKLVGTKGQSKK